MFTHIDLFSGIGGFSLAGQWAGFKTIAFCEIDPFCQEVLKARFGAIAESIVTNGGRENSRFIENKGWKKGQSGREGIQSEDGKARPSNIEQSRPILIPDIRDFDGSRFRGATLLTGGFPCQPFSVAGKRKGKDDPRSLWPEMLRVISEARPTWVIGENVTGIVNMELEQVCASLEGEGYEVQPIVIPACAVNAPHRRDRVWICGHARELGLPRIDGRRSGKKFKDGYCDAPDPRSGPGPRGASKQGRETEGRIAFGGSDRHAPDTEGNNLRPGLRAGEPGWKRRGRPSDLWGEAWPEVATRLCGVDDGISRRVDRLKALGNAIVPQVAYEIMKMIRDIEIKNIRTEWRKS